MSRMEGKRMYTIKDIWIAHVEQLLKENPEWWSRRDRHTRHFRLYRKQGTKVIEVNNYARFREMLVTYFTRARKAVIQGEAVNMTTGVGKICAKRVERDFRKDRQRKLNWNKTRKQNLVYDEVKGKMTYEKHIYFTDDDWCRIAWMKAKQIKNETVYEFTPAAKNSAGTTGFKLEFTQALERDPLLKFTYLFQPIID